MELGFSMVGVTKAQASPGYEHLKDWVASGYAAGMSYFEKRLQAYAHPAGVLPDVQSIMMLAMDYASLTPAKTQPGVGRVSRYAWGVDYHDLLRARLNTLCEWLSIEARGAGVHRGVVDSAPLMERDFAVASGLGWTGKNTLLIHPQRGSWFFLAAFLTTLPLEYDAPFSTDHCGVCTACLDACPTKAFPQPGVLNAGQCISYLTIEHKGPIPKELRAGIGDWLFGCDVCQEVCPWNRFAHPTSESAFFPQVDRYPVDVCALFFMTDVELRAMLRSTPLARAKPEGLLRNAAIVLGNAPCERGLAALEKGICHASPVVRGACVWALGNYPPKLAEPLLRMLLSQETNDQVLMELEAVLQSFSCE